MLPDLLEGFSAGAFKKHTILNTSTHRTETCGMWGYVRRWLIGDSVTNLVARYLSTVIFYWNNLSVCLPVPMPPTVPRVTTRESINVRLRRTTPVAKKKDHQRQDDYENRIQTRVFVEEKRSRIGRRFRADATTRDRDEY